MNNPHAANGAVKLPSEREREQIFHWLKRISSVTAWRRILGYYQAWVDVVEASARIADENGWNDETSLPNSEYVGLLNALAHCEEGVNRLAKGDKRVFKFDANGEFEMAGRKLDHWVQMLERISLGENGIKKHTPLWKEFCDALDAVAEAWGECGPNILEPRYLEEAALVPYGQWLQKELASMPFPAQLPPVPDPVESVFVRTGQQTPYSGIWEPIDVPKASPFSLLARKPAPKRPFMLAGCMNYLHGGSDAPQVTIETADDNIDIDTTWRLLWRDDRYEDGTIPEEEAGYRFTKPEAALPAPPVPVTAGETVWAESGAPAPRAGRWLAESDLGTAVDLQAGDRLPLHQGRSVRWVLSDE